MLRRQHCRPTLQKRKDGARSVGIVQCKDGPPAFSGSDRMDKVLKDHSPPAVGYARIARIR